MPVDEARLAADLERLAGGDAFDGDVLTALQRVTDACVDLFGVAGSGVMVADQQNMTRYVTSSDVVGRVLETAESETGQGPCTTAFVQGEPVAVSDLQQQTQWPELVTALQGLPVRAVLGVPVRLGGVPVGTLDVYRDVPHEWDETERRALLRYAELIGALLASALAARRARELADQLQYALDYRVVIERGVGFLMAREGVDAVEAFNRLRRASRSSRRKIGEVAEDLLATGQLAGG